MIAWMQLRKERVFNRLRPKNDQRDLFSFSTLWHIPPSRESFNPPETIRRQN